ncbi:MAG TPA: tetratricopeptide repeat protein [Candidatus Acidoferrum sp.]|nr:tetratricopeptide repeat protein [Candidatus Acidoferrum sp.]
MRIFLTLALAMAFLVPVVAAQKPPSPTPPASASPSRAASPVTSITEPTQPTGDLVMNLLGRVGTEDGSPVPNDVLLERVCNGSVRQQVHTSSYGDFSMRLGSRADSSLDASGEQSSQSDLARKDAFPGISQRELTNCDLRASASGFRQSVISLMGLEPSGGSINVGIITVQRTTKIEGQTLSAIPFKASKDARKAYDKGLDAERRGKPADARKYFETAVKIYPRYASAWFQLGISLQNDNQKDAARTAYTQAATIDTKFLPPYLSLASMAYEEGNWTEVLNLTDHILNLDPLNHANETNYILDLDPLNCSEAYYYNAVANYKLNRMEAAEKSGLKAEHSLLLTHFPQLHVLLAEIYARKSNYATAIAEIQTYLELAPHAQDADQVREQLAKLKSLDGAGSAHKNPDHQ